VANFQLVGLDPAQFQALFELPESELQARGIVRKRVDSFPGYPCRVSLQDAAVGEEVLLLPYAHHAVDSPYRALGPIYVRRGARQAALQPGEVPPYVSRRLISLRAYDSAQMMLAADVLDGVHLADRVAEQFEKGEVAYIHLHNAKPGCFSCLARRFIAT
jgi:hypothetical protein